MKYFSIAELTRSSEAKKQNISNLPSDKEIENLKSLVENLLDPIRAEWGHAIYVSSGFRCAKLNAIVHGSSTSHHLRGMAADISAGAQEQNKKLFDLICVMRQNGLISFTQLIDETKVKGSPYQWIHISYDPDNLKNQVMHGGYKDPKTGKTVYTYEDIE